MCETCPTCWRVETGFLFTGQPWARLHPVEFEFEDKLSESGAGSIKLRTLDVSLDQVWPWRTLIFFTRLCGCDIDPELPAARNVEFVGIITALEADDTGMMTVGFQHITALWGRRRLFMPDEVGAYAKQIPNPDDPENPDVVYGLHYSTDPASIASDLGARAVASTGLSGEPLPITSLQHGWIPSGEGIQERTYPQSEHSVIGEAIGSLVTTGVEWSAVTQPAPFTGFYETTVTFTGRVGQDRDTVLSSRRQAAGWSLTVDGDDQATRVLGTGAGDDNAALSSLEWDQRGIYPFLDEAMSYPEITDLSTLQDQTRGVLGQQQEPVAGLSLSLVGFDDPCPMNLGDTFGVDVCYGAVRFKGRVRVVSIAWSFGEDGTVRTPTFQPDQSASEFFLGQPHDDTCDCGGC